MSAIATSCPSCKVALRLAQPTKGKVKCPKCGAIFYAEAATEANKLPPNAGPRETESNLVRPQSKLNDTLSVPPSPQGEEDQLDGVFTPAQTPDELGRLGPYRVLKILGRGGMGAVFRAVDPRLDRPVALKVMLPKLAGSPSAKQRFLREARLAAHLRSDFIVTLFEVNEDRGIPYIAMEMLEGSSLEDTLRSGWPLELPLMLRIAKEMACGLADAHDAGLIHRDIKPGNIWLDARHKGRVKILDFGLARPERDDIQLTQPGAIVGTPAYMAPEQINAGTTIGAAADLFSLGCVLYRLAAGTLPFKGANSMGVLLAITSTSPVPPNQLQPSLPAPLAELIMNLLEKDPALRPRSAHDVVQRLTHIQHEFVPNDANASAIRSNAAMTVDYSTAVLPSGSAAPTAPRKRPRWPWILALALALPLAVFLAIVVLRMETPDGTLVIELHDEKAEARIKNGKVLLSGPDGKTLYTLAPSERNKKLPPGDYRIQVDGADGLRLDTDRFELRRGGEVTVRVTIAGKQPDPVAANDSDPERSAAKLVIALGGVVHIKGREMAVKTVDELPKEPIALTVVYLANNQKLKDKDMAVFASCHELEKLYLTGNQTLTHEGYAPFASCKKIGVLDLRNAAIDDVGLRHFKDCKLSSLLLDKSKVTDTGVSLFADCQLHLLYIAGTKISDATLKAFKDCKSLAQLYIGNTDVSDGGLVHLENLENIWVLSMPGTKITDRGLAVFERRHNFGVLDLSNTAISDDGLKVFERCKGLESLLLARTRVTKKGLAIFKDCKNLEELDIGETKLPDDDLDAVLAFKNVNTLNLSGTQVSAAWLANLKDFKKLTTLNLAHTKIGDPGLAALKSCKKLTDLNLAGTNVSDAGIVHLKTIRTLEMLDLERTNFTESGLEKLRKDLPRCRID